MASRSNSVRKNKPRNQPGAKPSRAYENNGSARIGRSIDLHAEHTFLKASKIEERLLFAKNFLQHPGMLGSLIPSSRFLVDRLLNKIDWAQARTIVEYGPGVGTITGSILSRMQPHARLVVFEMNEDFVRFLARNYTDPRLHVVHGSADSVHGELERLKLRGADYIVSGIPFTTMPQELRESIMRESRAALNPGGAVLVYQFTRAVLPCLRAYFNQIDQDFELRNILPARLFYCTQQGAY